MKEIGRVKLVQLQPSGLIIKTPSCQFYDASRRVEVDRLQITPLGIEAATPEGNHLLDIHHLSHPDKAYDDNNLVCIGFTAHYKTMRHRFGEHLVVGAAGENLIINSKNEIWLSDLGAGIAIENQETRQMTLLDLVRHASPCSEFSHFAAQSQDKKLPVDELKAVLQFLDKGRRGFLLVMRQGQPPADVRPGDRVFALVED